jgi:transcriptional antiterminator Rof (Rho-off)
VYEKLIVQLHPLRLQLDVKMGSRLMEYVWPERRRRRKESELPQSTAGEARVRRLTEATSLTRPNISTRVSMDGPRTPMDAPRLEGGRSLEMSRLAAPPLRRMATSRSFTDLRSATREQQLAPKLERGFSSYAFAQPPTPAPEGGRNKAGKNTGRGDAEEMKSRSAQKSFVLVRVPRCVRSSGPFHFCSMTLAIACRSTSACGRKGHSSARMHGSKRETSSTRIRLGV